MRGLLILLTALPLLAGCLDGTASYRLDGGADRAFTIQARQPWFWSEAVDIEAVMARPPECLRRSRLGSLRRDALDLELYRPEPGVFAEPILILRQGARFYAFSETSCESQEFSAAPPQPGHSLGVFQLSDPQTLTFVAGAAR